MRLIRGDHGEATSHGRRSGESLHGCDVCDYQGKFYEDVVVWRCEEDKRYPRGAQSGENIGLTENMVSSSFQFIPVSIKTDQGSQSGDGEGGSQA